MRLQSRLNGGICWKIIRQSSIWADIPDTNMTLQLCWIIQRLIMGPKHIIGSLALTINNATSKTRSNLKPYSNRRGWSRSESMWCRAQRNAVVASRGIRLSANRGRLKILTICMSIRPGRPSARLPIRQNQRRGSKLRCQDTYLVVGFSFDNAWIRLRPERPQPRSRSRGGVLAAFLQRPNGLTRILARLHVVYSYITPIARHRSVRICR